MKILKKRFLSPPFLLFFFSRLFSFNNPLRTKANDYTKKQNQIERDAFEKKKKKIEIEKVLNRRGALEQNIQLNHQQLEALMQEDDPETEIGN